MPYDSERHPEEEDRKDEARKKEKNTQKGSPKAKRVGKKYMFDPQPLGEGELPEWER
jgi:hypothetical protein